MTGRTPIGRTQSDHFRSHRSGLRTGTALVAGLAFASLAGGAHAQGFNGTPTSVTGAVVNGTNDDVTVFGSEAIITWNANATAITDTNVNFLPNGNTVTFHDPGSPVGDFTVLNRVFPSYFDIATSTQTNLAATISLAGTVNSNVSGTSGGNIWFYSPYGIILNGTAQFNVGSLLLTTSDIDTSNGGSLFLSQASGQQIGFLPAAQGNSFVRIQPGAQIAASDYSPNSAYVGIFAPRIEQGGSIRSDAMGALVAAEAGTITFNAGLIDIQVTQGTDESQGNGIVHTGSTGGAASTGEPQTLALVAIPKNNALTMLLGGAIGYDAATAATPDPSGVILSAGYQPTATAADLAAGLGDMRIGNTVFTSPTTAYATGTLDVLPQFLGVATPGLVDFQNDTRLYAGKQINLVAGAGEEIRGGGSLFIAPLIPLQGEDVSITVSGNAAISPSNGKIDVVGDFIVDASGVPAGTQGPPPLNGGDGHGGNITVAVSQGQLSAGNSLAFVSDGFGEDADVAAGNGFGGSIDIGVSNLGKISAPFFSAEASGFGGFGVNTGSTSGNGTGGLVNLHDDGGALTLTDVTLNAQGQGIYGFDGGGSGTGGQISLTIAGGIAQTWASLTADASASSDTGSLTAGSATGLIDGLNLHVTGSSSSLTVGALQLDNNAYLALGGAAPYAGAAGGVNVLVDAGGALTVNGFANLSAVAALGLDSSPSTPDTAPTMTGGTISILADGGTISSTSIVATADAMGVAGLTAAGPVTGGNVTLGALNGGTVALLAGQPVIQLTAVARGAVGTAPADAQGGNVTLFAQDGTIDANGGAILLSAAATSGGISDFSGGAGFAAQGGNAVVEIRAGTIGSGQILAGDITINAKGEAIELFQVADPFSDYAGGFTASDIAPIYGDGGLGAGGNATLNVAAGTLTAGSVSLHASGLGGSSGFAVAGNAPFQSGAGQGGQALVNQSGGAVTATGLDVVAQGQGGGYDVVGTGPVPLAGTGFGGTARISLSGGTMNLVNGLAITSLAIGGVGSGTDDPVTTAGSGGIGNNGAGIAELLMPPGSSALLTVPSISLVAAGLGGSGGINQGGGQNGNGGAAFGGIARYSLSDGGFAVSGGVSAYADALGGSGDTGGDATGGTAAFLLTDSVAAPATTRSIGSLLLNASPTGGPGASIASGGIATAGATQFTAQAGRAASALTIAGDFLADANGAIVPAGDGFTGNFGAIPVTVVGNAAISTGRDITMTAATGGGIAATGTLDLLGRSITTSGSGVLAADGNVTVVAVNSISLGGLSSGGTTLLQAVNPVTLAYGPVSVASLSSGGLVTAYASSFSATSPGTLTFADSFATTGDFTVQVAGDLTVPNITVPGRLDLASTGGLVAINGLASGATIAVASVDISLAVTGRLGQRGLTTSIMLTNAAPGAGTFVGGAGSAGAWSLDATEMTRLFADQSITIGVGSTALNPADVVIGNLSLTYGAGATANVGTGGTFAVSSPGKIRVVGEVAPAMSSKGDVFGLSGSKIDVVTDTGSIVLRDVNGALSGTLWMSAPTIRVATGATLTMLDSITSIILASALLDGNGGIVNNPGALQANAISVATGANTFYVQNSGVDTQIASRRGFTANSLTIDGLNGSVPSFAINGVLIDANGAAITGRNTYRSITINGAIAASGGVFNPFSTVNGCVIGNDCAFPLGRVAPPDDTVGALTQGLTPGSGSAAVLNLPIVQFGEPPLLDSPPLIDEPVTGVGNDDLWQLHCSADRECHG